MALFFAAHRWGNGEGIFDYEAEANAILHTMLHKAEDKTTATAMFDPETKLVVFVPAQGRVSQFSDPSYHVPHYYNLWAQWAKEDNDFWREATDASRAYLKLASCPTMPNSMGRPYNSVAATTTVLRTMRGARQ